MEAGRGRPRKAEKKGRDGERRVKIGWDGEDGRNGEVWEGKERGRKWTRVKMERYEKEEEMRKERKMEVERGRIDRAREGREGEGKE